MWTVEKEKAAETRRVAASKHLSDDCTHVVRDQTNRVVHIERVEKRAEVIRQHLARHRLCRTRIRLRGVAEASQVGRKYLKSISESRDNRLPNATELRPTMEEHQRRTTSLAKKVDIDVVGTDVERRWHGPIQQR
jgi:hypothetical protein